MLSTVHVNVLVWLLIVTHKDICAESRRSPTYEAFSRSRRIKAPWSWSSDDNPRSNPRAPKIEYIMEFGDSADADGPKLAGYTPSSSPLSHVGALNRSEHSLLRSYMRGIFCVLGGILIS